MSSGGTEAGDDGSETGMARMQRERLRLWSQGLDLQGHQVSYHVLEASDAAQALLDYARVNRVGLLVMGAATHGLQLQRLVATVPIRVAMHAPCTVMLVKQALPFEQLLTAPG